MAGVFFPRDEFIRLGLSKPAVDALQKVLAIAAVEADQDALSVIVADLMAALGVAEGEIDALQAAVTAAEAAIAALVLVDVDLQGQIDAIAADALGGTITSITAGVGLDGGVITDVGTIDLADTAVTPGVYGDATNSAQITVDQQGRITAATEIAISGGGGGGASSPVLRGSTLVAFSANTISVAFPVGTVAGDTVIIFTGHGWATTAPAGWTTISNMTGMNWNGAAIYRAITTAEAATGSVTVTFTGSFNGVAACAAFEGSRLQFRIPAFQRNSAGSLSLVMATDGTPMTTDYMVYFGSNRAASANTCSVGTLLQSVNAANGSAMLYGGAPSAAGGISQTYSFSVAGTGNYLGYICMTGF